MARTLFGEGTNGKVAIFKGGTPVNLSANAGGWVYKRASDLTNVNLAATVTVVQYGSDLVENEFIPTSVPNSAQWIYLDAGPAGYFYAVPPGTVRGKFLRQIVKKPGDTFSTTGAATILRYSSNFDRFTDPLANLGDIYFHSDLGYIGNSSVITASASHPVRTRSTSSSKRFFSTSTWNNPVTGEQDYAIGTHSFGTSNVPFICKIGTNQAPAGTVIQQVNQSVRVVFPYITSTHVRVKEQFITFNDSLPAHTQSYTFYVFNSLFTASGSTSISASGSNFTAGFGKLNSSFRYHRKTSSSPDFYVTAGATADVNTGAIKIVMPDGTTTTDTAYAGSFTGTTATGIKI